VPRQERERLLDCGEIQLLWLGGLPYIQKADSLASDVELLAVPVPQARVTTGNLFIFPM